MDPKGQSMLNRFRRLVQIVVLCSCLAGSFAYAQSDPFGELDVVYLDSVEAAPGENVIIRIQMRNDESLSSVSVPLTYDADLLTLTEISFTGSRAEYLQTKLINPPTVDAIDGHFVVAVQKIFEDPLPPGEGLFATLVFSLADTATVGSAITIDSLFMPPGGELLLVEAVSATTIFPEFRPGKVLVGQENQGPTFSGLTDQYVLEGETLTLDVTAADPDQDLLNLAVTTKPQGASFVDNGDGTGTLSWSPGYVGPSSADASPYLVSFWVGDGNLSSEQSISLYVVNVNRAPEVTGPTAVTIQAGDELQLPFEAVDPDFEPVTWSVLEGFDGGALQVNEGSATYVWQTAVTDAGSGDVVLEVMDSQGATDTASVTVDILSNDLYTLSLDSLSVDLGATVSANLRLENLVPVTGFEILLTYDVSAALVTDVTSDGTRSDGFEYFSASLDHKSIPGDIYIVGLVNGQDGPVVNQLSAGSGAIASLEFRMTSDIGFAGVSVPFRFRHNSISEPNANTLSDSLGEAILSDQIVYIDGRLNINSFGEIKIGDINLNNIAFEVSDVVRFTNYFIDPVKYGFNLQQYANSDINGDQLVATLSDLVALINAVVNGTSASLKTSSPDDIEAALMIEESAAATTLAYRSSDELGALLVTLEGASTLTEEQVRVVRDDMTSIVRERDGKVTILLYSMDGRRIPSGGGDLLFIDNAPALRVSRMQAASVDGWPVALSVSSTAVLPEDFALYQNYPNPFNPETNIEFDIPSSGRVELTVFNALGQRVRTLVDGELEAGRHTALWDGHNDNGSEVSSGIYFYRLTTSDASQTRKMLLLK